MITKLNVFILSFICLSINLFARDGYKNKYASYFKHNCLPPAFAQQTNKNLNDALTCYMAVAEYKKFDETDSSVQRESNTQNLYRGFGHYTEIGALAATQNRADNVTTAAFSFQTVNGYKFNRYFFTGVGVAADLYATQTTIPLFLSVRGDLMEKGKFIPYYFIDGGYGFDITSSSTNIDYKSGPMFAAGIGFKIPVTDNGPGFHVNFGYRLQKGATVENGVKSDYSNNRIALRAGFYL